MTLRHKISQFINSKQQANRRAAWQDWLIMELAARLLGYGELADKYRPSKEGHWRTIDKQTRKLGDEVRRQQKEKLGGRNDL